MLIHKIILSLIQAVILSIIYGFLATSLIFAQGQLLQDEGFELSTPNGTFPDAGYWKNSDAGGGADASCTTTAAYSGNNGLWEYTGNETWAWWSGPYQEFPSSAGTVYQSRGWIRTPSVGEGGSWVDGSKASVRIVFLNSSRSTLTYNESPGITTIGSPWSIYSVTSDPAPIGTKYVRFVSYIAKPQGTPGISVANFDDCFFENIVVIPTVATQDADNISPNGGTLQGSITSTGGEDCDERGFEWGTSSGSYPINWTETGSFGTGDFEHKITGLNPQTDTYFRAKARNSAGWGYGSERQFTTTGTVATPIFDPSPGTYASTQDVSISCATPEATIHYTTDGSEPNEASDIYASPIPISATTTLKARAYKSGWTPSGIAGGVYTIIAAPTVTTQDADSIGASVAILHGSIANTGGENCDERGFEWGTSSGNYPNSWTETGSFGTGDFGHKITGLNPQTIYYFRAKAHNSAGWGYASERQFPTVGTVATPIFSPPEGTYLGAQDVGISCATPEATIHYTTDGSEPTESDLIYNSPINITSTITLKARAYKSGWNASSVASGFYMITHSNSAKASLGYLADVMDQYHKRFIVYEDVSSAGNHFHAFAKIPDKTAAVEINGSYADNPHSGATAIRCEFRNTTGTNFGGFYFQNGILPPDSLAPIPNFGEVPDAGIGLSGADSLIFWARGEQGGEKIEFFVAGVGRDAVTGTPIAPYPGSSPRHPELGTIYTLETEWKKFTFDLTGLNLSYVLGGFGWVANAPNNPNGAVFYLDDIYYELSPPSKSERLNEPRFLRSFTTLSEQPDPNDENIDDDLDLVLRNTAFTYDNALALIAFLADSLSEDSMRRAMLIGDAFVYAALNDRFYTDGRLRDAYAAGDVSLPPGWTPNGLSGTVPVPGFYDESQQRFFEVEGTGISTGNNAWAMIALLALHKRTDERKYLDTARRIGEFIQGFRNDSGLYQGFQGGLDDAETQTPVRRAWASTEHNLDICAAFFVMYQITGESQWQTDAQHALEFVEAMWDAQIGCYLTGTMDPENRNMNPGQLPLDTQSWSILALPDTLTFKPQLFECAEQNHRTVHHGFNGFDFNQDKDGVWFEGLAQMAVAYATADDQAAESLRGELRNAQQTDPFGDGRGIAAACHDGVSTGFGFKLFRRLHVGATSWNVFAQLKFNPYYQGPIPPEKPTTIQSTGDIPTEFSLGPNYPNPFNPETTIQYKLPKSSQVQLVVYNLLGQRVVTLVDKEQSAGSYSVKWDGKDDFGRNVASGIYLSKLETPGFVKVRKLALVQ